MNARLVLIFRQGYQLCFMDASSKTTGTDFMEKESRC